MLGIRRYRGVAIDLWQGDCQQFVCDAQVQANAASLGQADGQGLRHAAVVVASEPPSATLAAVRSYLDGARPGLGLRRISIVLPNGPIYAEYQEALFALFPEDDDAHN